MLGIKKKRNFRKTNFTVDEIRIILEEYEASQTTIEAKFSPSITNAAKQVGDVIYLDSADSSGVETEYETIVYKGW